MHSRNNPRGHRKRPNEQTVSENIDGLLSTHGDTLPQSQSGNVVEEDKVKQYLNRLKSEFQRESDCIKILVCDSEAIEIATIQDSLLKDFEIILINVSEKNGLSIDRIVSIYGPLRECARCALFISFILNSKVNNIVKRDTFTLKLTNYSMDILVEGTQTQSLEWRASCKADIAEFQNNINLYLVTLSGDFLSMFTSICLLIHNHPYQAYMEEDAIELLPSVRIHDMDFMYTPSMEDSRLLGGNKEIIRNLFN